MFDQYRQFIQQDPRYQNVRELYTETEALISLEAETIERQPEPPEQESEPGQKKVERFPVLEGLRRIALGHERQHVLLAGRPGSGKSTTLQRLLLELADAGLAEAKVIPVYVQLKRDRPITDLILAEFRKAKVRVTLEQLDDWLLRDQLLLLLDGVNEIPSEERRRQLQDFRDDNPNTPMIFTTRDLAVGGDLGIEKRLEMRPLSESQMRKFVEKYLTKEGMPDQADTLLRQLSDRLREIAETPLLLQMLCEVFTKSQQIPQSKGNLFRQFDQKYDHIKNDKEYVPVSENFWDFKAEILQFLAFAMIQTDNKTSVEAWYSLSRDRAEILLGTWLKDRGVVDSPTKAKLWLKDLRRCHLLQAAKDPGDIEFHHQLFQEYYAAEYLLRLLPTLSDDQLKQNYLNLLKWTEPIALMLPLVKDEERALRVVELAIDNVDLMLGARLAGSVKQNVHSKTICMLIKKPSIPEWLMVELLQLTKSPMAVSLLIKILRSAGHETRTYVSYILGEMGSLQAVPALTDMLLCSDFNARSSAAEALAKIDTKDSRSAILKALANQEYDVCLSILAGVEKSDTEIVSLTFKKAIKNPNPQIREVAVRRLGRLSLRDTLPMLIETFRSDASSLVRFSAIEALSKTDSDAITPLLREAVQDKDFSISRFAEKRLKKITSSEGVKAQKVDRVEELLLSAFDEYGYPVPDKSERNFVSELKISELLERLADESFLVRQAARYSLSRKEGCACSALPHLTKLLTTHAGIEAFQTLTAIQNRCQFYKYEIWQEAIENAKLESQKKEQATVTRPTNNIFNIATLQANNSALNLGGTIQGDQIGTQNPKPEP